MTLRTDFNDLSDPIADHIADHTSLHKRYNTAIFVDDYNSIQDALNAAATGNIPVVCLNPTTEYSVTETINVPACVTLDGGSRGYRSSTALGARLKAMTDNLDPMITVGQYSGVRGCYLLGNYKAITGILCQTNFVVLEDNFINALLVGGAAIKMGGALYPTMRRNLVSNCAGYGLDALDAYATDPSVVYYGVNHGLSEQNVWGAKMGGMRVEGLLTSICDDFELSLDGEAVVVVGGTVSTTLNMQTPYFEVSQGEAEVLKGIVIKGSARLELHGGMIYGESANLTDSVAIDCQTPGGLTIMGTTIARWSTGIAGVMATRGALMVGGNVFPLNSVGTHSTLDNALADVALYHVRDDDP